MAGLNKLCRSLQGCWILFPPGCAACEAARCCAHEVHVEIRLGGIFGNLDHFAEFFLSIFNKKSDFCPCEMMKPPVGERDRRTEG